MKQEKEFARDWSYLGSIHAVYMDMMEKYKSFAESTTGISDFSKEKKKFMSAISTFRFMVLHEFDNYLRANSDDFDYSPKDYAMLPNNKLKNHQLLEMFHLLVDWAQSEGPFSLMNDSNKRDNLWFS